ncbi:sulfate adenylyltransferase [Shewanella hanedai]|uniref:transglutaminase-like cysteine peptidase n=1 Tax=Shewanella hanedai TaxID=25 RepID=UPI0019BAEA32|nr:transglutaminase-like cysteine peptidase [Shewanella hanedai]GGI98575.1 sulfate adenylyltransferase [Shewanella hanedai]
MKYFIVLFCILLLLIPFTVSCFLEEHFTADFYQKFSAVYGKEAEVRAKNWETFLVENSGNDDWNKINKINDFINKSVIYETDLSLWDKEDYWASPAETLGRGRGDCEDFAIAKYFSLLALGIPEGKLRLMYVRQLQIDEPHMVLIYFENKKAIPLVLDNFNPRILPANKRPDLKPIYSFNGSGLWMSKAKGLGKKVKNSSGVSAWTKLLQRIEQVEMNVPASKKDR